MGCDENLHDGSLKHSIISELKQRCKTLMICCERLMKHLHKECSQYINCDKMLKFCKMAMKLNSSKSKKKSKKSRK